MRAIEFSDLLGDTRRKWLVTGVAGFIGSHLAEVLLMNGQDVVGIDDFSTGSRSNVEFLSALSGNSRNFRFVQGSVEDPGVCRDGCEGAEIVLHQAALGSIPRSIEDPARTHSANATGTLNMLLAARNAAIRRFVYASSSSVYGDDPTLPKREDRTGLPLAPYASSKRIGEYYARNCADHYGLQTIGLRYFNVFGKRQDPAGAYAAVIPRWISSLCRGEQILVNGDGETSRDFCYIANVVQANFRAALSENYSSASSVFNIAAGGRTTLNELYSYIADFLRAKGIDIALEPVYGPERPGDVRHSQADISRAKEVLGYMPTHDVVDGLRETVDSYCTGKVA